MHGLRRVSDYQACQRRDVQCRKEIIQRAITNYTSLIQAYSSGKGIFNYKYACRSSMASLGRTKFF
jgi:hypothetical protein